jgi:hypothetical protein
MSFAYVEIFGFKSEMEWRLLTNFEEYGMDGHGFLVVLLLCLRSPTKPFHTNNVLTETWAGALTVRVIRSVGVLSDSCSSIWCIIVTCCSDDRQGWTVIGFVGFLHTKRDHTSQIPLTETHTIKYTYTHIVSTITSWLPWSVAASNGERPPSSAISNCPVPQLQQLQ